MARRPQGTYTVQGQDHKGNWLVQRPDGLMCSGIWHSEKDAQATCDSWNARKTATPPAYPYARPIKKR